MQAAKKHTAVAFVSFALLAALAVAGSAGGVLPVKRDREAPSAPTNVRVTSATPTTISLAWDASTDNVGVAFYYVYVDAVRARVSGTTYTATNLQCGQSVGVWIVAYDLALNKSPSAATTVSTAACLDMEAPTPPSGFRQAATSENAVVLAWDDSTDDIGVVGYVVYRNQLFHQSASAPTADLTGLVCGSTYEYQVDAVDAAGNRSALRSAWVETAECRAVPPPPAGAWTFCSDEWEQCTFTGTKEVRYGANGTFTAPRVFSNGVSCTNSIFGDPLPGTVKRCEYRDLGGTPPPPDDPPADPPADRTPPSQPSGLRANGATATSVSLTWSPSSDDVGVVGYDAYRNGTRSVFLTSTSVTHGNLTCGNSYWFGIAARDGAGNRSPRARVKATTSACIQPPPPPTVPPPPPPNDSPPADTSPPTQPASLAVSGATRTSVSLSWNASTDNSGVVVAYRVYVNGTAALNPTQPGATVSALSCGTAFTFEVDAADAAGNRSTRARLTASTAACPDAQAPSVPTNVSASSRTATSIALSWSASSDNVGVTSYGLYRGGTLVGTSATTTGIFSGLACNTNYTLAVDAADSAANRSAKVNVMVATTACPDSAPPSAPTGLSTSNVTQTSLSLTWNASTDNVAVAGYDVYRNGTKMESTTSRSSGQSGLSCGTAYWFGVEALDAAGNHSARASVNATTAACPPTAPPPPPPPSPPPTPPDPSGPITITQGGTYTGNWVGSGIGPAVKIATSAPVTIQNSTIKNTGAAPLIDANYPGAQLTVHRSTLDGAAGSVGKAVYADNFKSVRVENCTINFTWGIRLDAIQAGGTIVVTKNRGRNMVRNASDPSHFFQAANHAQQPAQIDVSWNEIINTFGQSGVEDVINMYGAGYAKIHDNYIQGAYPDTLGGGYSGSGIMLDSGAHDNEVYNNIVVDTVNAGIGIASGWNNAAHDNRLVFDGRNDAGNLFAAANIGGYVWNYDGSASWNNNHMTRNTVGWVKANGERNDLWFPHAPSSDYGTNSALPNPITRQTEQGEYQNWLAKLAANGVTVGA